MELSGASTVIARTTIDANDNVASDNVVYPVFGSNKVVANEDFALAA